MSSTIMASWYAANQDKFDGPTRLMLQKKVATIDDDKASIIASLELKNPTVFILADLFGGFFGLHQFMLGNTGMAVFELLTGGGCGVMWLVDLFSIKQKVQKLNLQLITPYL